MIKNLKCLEWKNENHESAKIKGSYFSSYLLIFVFSRFMHVLFLCDLCVLCVIQSFAVL
jgi:hypothetical protein